MESARMLLQGNFILEGEIATKAELLANLIVQKERPMPPIRLGSHQFDCVIKSISELNRREGSVQAKINVQ